MICRSCGYPQSSVIYTRHNEFNNLTQRRRECLKCGIRYTTEERPKDYRSFSTIPPKKILDQ